VRYFELLEDRAKLGDFFVEGGLFDVAFLLVRSSVFFSVAPSPECGGQFPECFDCDGVRGGASVTTEVVPEVGVDPSLEEVEPYYALLRDQEVWGDGHCDVSDVETAA
jgi:hypothetical protein